MKIINIHLILIIFISALNKIYFRIQYSISGILGFSYDSKEYTYRKNLQGDITDIVDDNGKVVAHYDYDAYGNQRIYGYHDNQWLLLEDTLTHEGIYSNATLPLQLPYLLSDKDTLENNHIAYINPFRYRSYYYDTKTNLYYLTTRYYDPETGRFINADDISYADPETINGLNLFAYCANNPVMFTDSTGTNWWTDFWHGGGNWFQNNWKQLVIGTAVVVAGAVVTFFTAGMGAAGLMAAGGALLASAKAVGVSMAISGGIGTLMGGITGGWQGALQGFGNGLADGFMWGGIFAGGAQILSGAMSVTRNFVSSFNGKSLGNVKLWSPNSATNPNVGGTLIKIGKVNRLDVEIRQLLHMHLSFIKTTNAVGRVIYPHIPIGIILSSIIGGFSNVF